MACALEALSNLSLQPEVRAQIQPILIKALHKVQPEFLPTMLKYLFSDCDSSLVDEVIIVSEKFKLSSWYSKLSLFSHRSKKIIIILFLSVRINNLITLIAISLGAFNLIDIYSTHQCHTVGILTFAGNLVVIVCLSKSMFNLLDFLSVLNPNHP